MEKKKKQGALTRDNLTRKNSQILAVAPDQLTLIEIKSVQQKLRLPFALFP